MVTYLRLRTKYNFKLSATKMVPAGRLREPVALLQDVPNIMISPGKLVAEDRLSLTRGDHLQEVPGIVI